MSASFHSGQMTTFLFLSGSGRPKADSAEETLHTQMNIRNPSQFHQTKLT